MNPLCVLLIVFGIALAGCGRDSGHPAAPALIRNPLLIRSPPVDRLSAQQLRSLSMDCEKYSPEQSARGPYDAAYCEDAMAAWADSPLQIVTLERPPAEVAPAAKPVNPAKIP